MLVGELMTREVVTVREWEELGLSSDLLRFRRFRHLPVVDAKGKLVGILSRTDVLEQASRPGNPRLIPVYDVIRRNPIIIHPGASMEEAAERMKSNRIHCLPVVDEEQNLVGIITDTDILGAVSGRNLPTHHFESVLVSDVMTENPITVDLEADVGEAAGSLLEGGFRHLPVLDANQRLVGMLSERDLRSALGTDFVEWGTVDARRLEEVIANVMVPEPVVVRADNKLIDILEAFTDERIGAVPVLDREDVLVGILSYVDILKWLEKTARRSGVERGQGVEPFQELH